MSYVDQSHPEHAEEVADRREAVGNDLVKAARAIRLVQQGLRPAPSDRAFVKRWPGLSSAKVYSLAYRGETEGMNVERLLTQYRGVMAALDVAAEEKAEEELYDDLEPAEALQLAVLRLLAHRGKNRLIIVEGGSGAGKTSAIDLLERSEVAGSLIKAEADDSWKSLRAAMGALLIALGEGRDRIPNSTADRMSLLEQVCNRKGRIIIAIDESHRMTGQTLNLITTLINRTPAMFIIAGVGTLMRKLHAAASEEAKQLKHNRLFARIELRGPTPMGAFTYLTRRLGVESPDWQESTLKTIAGHARNAGMWAFLRGIVERVLDDGDGAEADDSTLLAAASSTLAELK